MSERPGCESLRAYQFDRSNQMSELKRHVMGEVHFEFYRDGNLWYRSDSGLSFPVPVDDVGTATFKRDDKALLFMRYIRKFLAIRAAEMAAPHGETSGV
jgi:hypothetical protein